MMQSTIGIHVGDNTQNQDHVIKLNNLAMINTSCSILANKRLITPLISVLSFMVIPPFLLLLL